MANSRYYIKIKDKNIPVIVRNYKNTNAIKIFFNIDVLNISKPKWYSLEKVIKEYGDEIYSKYTEIISIENNNIRHWLTGEKILYSGEEFNIIREKNNSNKINIKIVKDEKVIYISLPENLTNETEIRENVSKAIKKLFKNNTEYILQEKVKFWSERMNIEYATFKVNDTSSKFGSCMPKNKKLFFSLSIIMLPSEIADIIIVHELAHIIHPNHSKEFYNLIKKYIPDYDKKDKWLKSNNKLLII